MQIIIIVIIIIISSIYRDMIYCVLNICKGVWVTLEKEHYWYEHVPKLVKRVMKIR
jgi:hypothetical protein